MGHLRVEIMTMKRFSLLLLTSVLCFQPIGATKSKPEILVPALMTVGFGAVTSGIIWHWNRTAGIENAWQQKYDTARADYSESYEEVKNSVVGYADSHENEIPLHKLKNKWVTKVMTVLHTENRPGRLVQLGIQQDDIDKMRNLNTQKNKIWGENPRVSGPDYTPIVVVFSGIATIVGGCLLVEGIVQKAKSFQ